MNQMVETTATGTINLPVAVATTQPASATQIAPIEVHSRSADGVSAAVTNAPPNLRRSQNRLTTALNRLRRCASAPYLGATITRATTDHDRHDRAQHAARCGFLPSTGVISR